jgi:hypothetical protein
LPQFPKGRPKPVAFPSALRRYPANLHFPNFYKLLFIPRFRLRSPYHGILPERHFFILSFTKDKMKQNYQFLYKNYYQSYQSIV